MLEEDGPLLQKLAKECKDAKEHDRYLALHAVSKGYEVSTVAEIFCIDESSIYGWIKKWKDEGTLSDRPKSGRPPAFTEKEKKELKRLIDENDPKTHGINASFWDCNELRKYYLSIGKNVSEDAIERTLLAMGAHYVKAQLEYREADIQKQRDFAIQFLKEIQNSTKNTVLLFEDEMATCTSPHKGYGWTFNERLIVKTRQSHKEKLNTFGATNPINGRRVQMSTKIAKAPAMVKFLDKIDAAYPSKNEIWLYLDNGPVHKSKLVKEWQIKHPRIKFKPMPPYSPELNPQELVWSYDRRKYLNNHQFTNGRQLSMGLSWFVKKLEPTVVKSVCSLIPIEALLSFQV